MANTPATPSYLPNPYGGQQAGGYGSPYVGSGFTNLSNFLNQANLGWGANQDWVYGEDNYGKPRPFDPGLGANDQSQSDFNNWMFQAGHPGPIPYQINEASRPPVTTDTYTPQPVAPDGYSPAPPRGGGTPEPNPPLTNYRPQSPPTAGGGIQPNAGPIGTADPNRPVDNRPPDQPITTQLPAGPKKTGVGDAARGVRPVSNLAWSNLNKYMTSW